MVLPPKEGYVLSGVFKPDFPSKAFDGCHAPFYFI
jgi:hypothetical protein